MAEKVVKTVLAVLKGNLDLVTLYEVPYEDLMKDPDSLEDPPEEWAYPLVSNSENVDSFEENTEVMDVYKVPKKLSPIEREPSLDDTKSLAFNNKEHPLEEETKGTDSVTNTSQELHFDSDDSEVERSTNTCLITGEPLTEFSLLKVIGKGAFGRVFLAKKDSGEVFAMKRIRKDKVLRSNAVKNILLERKILSEVNHPLLLGIRHAFASKYRFYFFCDYILGGDLMRHLS